MTHWCPEFHEPLFQDGYGASQFRPFCLESLFIFIMVPLHSVLFTLSSHHLLSNPKSLSIIPIPQAVKGVLNSLFSFSETIIMAEVRLKTIFQGRGELTIMTVDNDRTSKANLQSIQWANEFGLIELDSTKSNKPAS